MNIEITRLHTEAIIPTQATIGSAGYDLYACKDQFIREGESKIELGIAINIKDKDVVGLIFSRSSTPITLANSVGVIDSDYQGELKLKVPRIIPEPISIKQGERIAQLVFINRIEVLFQEVDSFNLKTTRGAGGFGSSGK